MRILLTGCGGQLGRHLADRLAPIAEVIRTDRADGDFQCDLGDHRLLRKSLDRVRPEIIVNPAAWTAVDRAEDEPATAGRLNRDLPGWIGEWAAAHDALVVHFSTDYVFSGAMQRGWREEDRAEPANVYGRTKLEGEQRLAETGARSVIVRTAWLYSHFPGNFLSAILTRAGQGKPLSIVADQIGSPTWAGHLADAVTGIVKRRDALDSGCTRMHVAGRGQMSWYEFGRMAIDEALRVGVLDAPVEVTPIESANWPQKARRPVWSVLDCSRYEEFSGAVLPSPEQGLKACLQNWKNSLC